jgi:hypothetical protein
MAVVRFPSGPPPGRPTPARRLEAAAPVDIQAGYTGGGLAHRYGTEEASAAATDAL